MNYPALRVNLSAMESNARVLTAMLKSRGIDVAGVVKVSDGDTDVARAYLAGGCRQIAVSRVAHLPALRKALPEAPLMLIRPPCLTDLDLAAGYADLVLCTDKTTLSLLSEAAEAKGRRVGVVLMLDVGDLREGVDSIEALVDVAVFAEALTGLDLKGVGTNLACLNGVLPNQENLSFLLEGARAVEKAIGRPLEIVSGGSSIDLLLSREGGEGIPEGINHLRLGGIIANPLTIHLSRGLTFPGLREDTVTLTAQIIEIETKASAPKKSTTNWRGETVRREDLGRRRRAILALGSQDVGDASTMVPVEAGVAIVGCSSDHTVLDITDCDRDVKVGDTVTFRLRYANILYAFSTRHVTVYKETQ